MLDAIWSPIPTLIPTIDTAAWFGHFPFRRIDGSSLADLAAKAGAMDIRRLIVSPFESLFWENNFDAYEQWIDSVSSYPMMRLWPVVNPAMPGQLRKLQRLHERYRFGGVRLLPSYHGYSLFDPPVADLMDLARQCGLIVQVFRRLLDDRYQWILRVGSLGVEQVEYLSSRWPDQNILLSAFDLFATEMPTSLAGRLMSCPNVYADLAWLRGPRDDLLQLVRQPLADRLVYGSLWPLHVMESTHWQLTQADLPPATLRKLLYDNAERLLGRSQSAAVPQPTGIGRSAHE